MLKMWTLTLAAGLTAVLLAVSQAARAGDGAGMHAGPGRLLHGEAGDGEGHSAHLEAAAALLELSPSQRKEVAAVLAAALPSLETRALAVVEAHADQLETVHAVELDAEAMRAASRLAGAAQGELAVAVAELLHDVHSVLTKEQLERLAHLHRPDLLGGLAEHVRAAGRSARAWADRQ